MGGVCFSLNFETPLGVSRSLLFISAHQAPRSCPYQLSRKFQLLIKTKIFKKIKTFLAFKLSDIVFIMLTFMSMINFELS